MADLDPTSRPAPPGTPSDARTRGPATMRRRLLLITAIAATVLFVTMVYGGYALGWKWTGLSHSVRLWDWLEVIALPLALGIAPLLLTDRRRLTGRHRRLLGAILIGFTGLVAAGYLVPLKWTGFTGNTLWDWLGLTLLPLVIATTSLWCGRWERLELGHLAAAVTGLVLCIAVIFAGYVVPWAWTGFTGNTAWDWLKLLLVPLLLPTVAVPLTHGWIKRGLPPQEPAPDHRRARADATTPAVPRSVAGAPAGNGPAAVAQPSGESSAGG